MEPIKHLLNEKIQLRQLRTMRKEIYRKVASLRVEYHPSKEPIPASEKEKLTYTRLYPGGVWGWHLYDCAWFHITGSIPTSAQGKHVVVHISIGGEGLVYEGSEPTQSITSVMSYIDRQQASVGKTTLEIANPAAGNEKIDLYLDGGYNGIYNVLVGAGIFWFADLCVVDDELLSFYYDYLTLASLLSVTEDAARRAALETALAAAFRLRSSDRPAAIATLAPFLHGPEDPSIRFTAIGHSHLDLAWLWPIRETKRKAARTFANQLRNVKATPDYVYGASQPQQFDYIKHKYPRQFAAMQQMAKTGNLELQGGMWVEADTNLASGEALIRQIHYGKQFFREEFGQEMRICWLPDVFGYNGNLPQILKKTGLPYFMTIKLSWNEHNRFPYRSFNWDGIDGSRVLVHMAPDDTYNSAGSPACASHAKENYPEIDIAPEALMIFGIGDGGGGPGEAHIELVKRQLHLQDSPSMHFGKAVDFFDRLAQWKDKLPVHQGELYLEKHQGTYTTQGRNKKFNRRCEYALQTLESLCAIAYAKGLA
ncbi:MAG: alpha-mannosidase, partial [Candidatus Omnitrophota bacterium]|nr:alpha-mannosidase [Candidatus Omnitrophota bacterium]